MSSTAELASSYAALILADEGLEITVRLAVAGTMRNASRKIVRREDYMTG